MSEDKSANCSSSFWPPPGNAGVAGHKTTAGESAQGNTAAIRDAIQRKYAEVSVSAKGKFSYPTGREGAEALGYDPGIINSAPARILESFCGVGNPFSLGKISPGDAVLDFGCGAGFDLFVASGLAGKGSKICGVDLTEHMAERAKENLASSGVINFEILRIYSEAIPFGDDTFDVVISNGVINLVPDKAACFGELFRVLKPGGRIQFADVVVENELPAHLAESPEAWSHWIGGTVPVRDQISLLEGAGFIEVTFAGNTAFRTSSYTIGALFTGRKPGQT